MLFTWSKVSARAAECASISIREEFSRDFPYCFVSVTFLPSLYEVTVFRKRASIYKEGYTTSFGDFAYFPYVLY